MSSNRRHRIVLIGGSVLAIVVLGAVYAWYRATAPDHRYQTIIDRENRYTQISYRRVGDYLGKRFAGKTLVVITDPYVSPTRDELVMEALREGIAGRLPVTIVTLGSPDDDPEALGAIPAINANAFDALLGENVPGYSYMAEGTTREPQLAGNPRDTVVLSLVGLPFDYQQLALFSSPAEERPYLALVNANLYGLLPKFRDGSISMALFHNPVCSYNPPDYIPDDDDEAFDLRYILVTDENIEEIHESWSFLFGDE